MEHNMVQAPRNGNGKSTNVFFGVDGKPTTTDDQIVASYKEEAKVNGLSLDLLTDEEILGTVKAIVGNELKDESIRVARYEALIELQTEKEDEEGVTDTSAMSEHLQEASNVADEIGEIADPWMEVGADSNETRIGAPLHLAIKLMQDYGDKWGVEFAENGMPIRCPGALQLPVPGSSSEDAEGTWGNNPLDVIKGKNGKEYFYRSMADGIGAGVQLLSDINDLKAMGPAYVPGSARNKALETRYSNDVEGRKSKLKQLNTRRNQRSTVLSRAVGFCQALERVNTEFDEEYFEVKFVEPWEQFAEAAKRTACLQFTTKGNRKKGIAGGDTDAFSLTNFIGLLHPSPINGQIRIERAKQLMGGKVHLAAAKLRDVMKERKPDETGNQGGGTGQLGDKEGIPTPEKLESFASLYMNEVDSSRGAEADLYRKRFYSFLNQQGPEADRRLSTFEDFVAEMVELRGRFKDRLARIEAEQQAKQNTKAA
jgi:hypothetical protein